MSEHIIDIPEMEVQDDEHVIDIGEDSLKLRGKLTWLEYVQAKDCIKDKVSNCYLMQLSKSNESQNKESNQGKLAPKLEPQKRG